MKRKLPIKTFSTAELLEARARGESKTDLGRVRAKSEAELDRDIAGDPDFNDQPRDWYMSAKALLPPAKTALSIRLDEDVVDWFKRQGPGYQTKMNAVLRAFVQHAEKEQA